MEDVSKIDDYLLKIKNGYNPLNDIDVSNLLDSIEKWKDVDLRVISDDDLSNRLLSIVPFYMASMSEITTQKIYRVRPLVEETRLTTKDEILYPQIEKINKAGRINNANEAVLYCSMDQVSPIYECKIKEKEWFALIQYSVKAKNKINLSNIIQDKMPDGLNDNGQLAFKIMNNFIRTEFTKPVGIGTEYLYKASRKICIDMFDLPDSDGWIYHSVASFVNGYNVALKPVSVDKKLQFDCVLICQLFKINDDKKSYNFYVKHKANKIIEDKLVYEF